MSQRAPLPDLLKWMDLGSAAFLAAVQDLDDRDFREPSMLPGWSHAHIVAHVGFNAKALLNLVSWAKSGVRTPMYASADQRNEDIATGASWSVDRLRAFVEQSAEELDTTLATMTLDEWKAEIVTAQGREVTALEIPWMRTREVAIHAVDLANGTDFADFPGDFCRALIADVVMKRSSQSSIPHVIVRTDDGAAWTMGSEAPAVEVHGSPPDLAAWLTGRSTGRRLRSSAPVPALGPWL